MTKGGNIADREGKAITKADSMRTFIIRYRLYGIRGTKTHYTVIMTHDADSRKARSKAESHLKTLCKRFVLYSCYELSKIELLPEDI